jgi:rod shape determining protein RodA
MLPITGVPLPLISYSGSFVLMIMFGLGLVNSVWIHRKAAA